MRATCKYRGVTTMQASQLMTIRKLLTTIIDRWRAALIVFGVALTVLWLILLIWFPLHLLEII
jgi:hypothetical protein